MSVRILKVWFSQMWVRVFVIFLLIISKRSKAFFFSFLLLDWNISLEFNQCQLPTFLFLAQVSDFKFRNDLNTLTLVRYFSFCIYIYTALLISKTTNKVKQKKQHIFWKNWSWKLMGNRHLLLWRNLPNFNMLHCMTNKIFYMLVIIIVIVSVINVVKNTTYKPIHSGWVGLQFRAGHVASVYQAHIFNFISS